MATNNQLNVNLSGVSGSGNFVGSTSSSLVTPILGAATATSLNLGTALSKYIQATWTPSFTFSTPGNISVVYTTQNGSYTRFGNIVFVEFTLVCTPTFTTSAGNLLIGGFVINSAISNASGEIGVQGTNIFYSAGFTGINITTTTGTSVFTLKQFGSSKLSTLVGTGSITSGVQVSFAGSITFNV
jgi:hypothetical protein